MFFPQLSPLRKGKEYLQTWSGYDHNLRIPEGSFYDMKNLSGDSYPVLQPRKRRSLYRAAGSYVRGMLTRGKELWYVAGDTLYKDNRAIEGFAVPGDEYEDISMVAMGAYIIFYSPGSNNMTWYNTEDPEDNGFVYQSFAFNLDNPVKLELCDREGNVYTGIHKGTTAPAEPEAGALWLDTTDTLSLKKWEAGARMWLVIAKTFVRISADAGPDHWEIRKGDCIELGLGGITVGEKEALTQYNVVEATSEGEEPWFVVVTGIIDGTKEQDKGIFIVRREVPAMDYMVECDNRLWGCRYGYSDAEKTKRVNEIYACALGDFKNWRKYQGLSTDSYAASRGSHGPWTGAIVYQGSPIFFKGDSMEKVYISSTGAHQISVHQCRGPLPGACGSSIAIVNDILYWHTGSEAVAYNGTYPQTISKALGAARWDGACAGALDGKYYLWLHYGGYGGQRGQESGLYVYDTRNGLWYKEELEEALSFAGSEEALYCRNYAGQIIKLNGEEWEDCEKPVAWMGETGDLGLNSPGHKYISRLRLRLYLPEGSWVKVYIQYDSDGIWQKAGYAAGGGVLKSKTIALSPRRCDHFRLKLEGQGEALLYSMGKYYEEGSDWI